MFSILNNRVVHPVFFSSIRQYLCPILIISATKNPAAVIFNLNYDKPNCGSNDYVYLAEGAISFSQVNIMENGIGVNTLFQQGLYEC